jgi:ParB-like chromosome segregation protein Spo0J
MEQAMFELSDFFVDESKLDERTIQMYERRIKNGEKLHSIILRAHVGGRYELIDGFHRLAAMRRCGTTQISGAFVFSGTDDDTEELRRELNRREDN